MNNKKGIDAAEWIILALGGFVILYQIMLKVDYEFISFQSYLTQLLTDWRFYVIVGILLLSLIYYLNYKFNFYLYRTREKRKQEELLIEDQSREIDSLFKNNLSWLNSEELESLIEKVQEKLKSIKKSKRLKKNYSEFLSSKLVEIKNLHEIALHEDKVKTLECREFDIKQNIERLEREKRNRIREEHQERQDILNDLHASEHSVFKRDDLNDSEVNALKSSGYSKVNEYCPYEQKVIGTLIRPPLNHSKTHAFLVWSVKRILENLDEVKNIQEHLTVNADLTFYFNKKPYAIEIETGNLLRKKEQLSEKIKYLNRNFHDRWFIVVSHRKLLPKYRKYGQAVERKNVQKYIEKQLK